MLIKIISLFLIAMVALALFGRFRVPRLPKRDAPLAKPKTCPKCGRYIIGNGGCICDNSPDNKG